jgi:hypothetical protein
MSYQELVKQGERTFENICNVDKQKLFQNPNNLQPWNGLGFNDFVFAFEELIETVVLIYQNNVMENLPFNLINSMNSQLSNILQSCNIFTSNRNQQHFQSAFQHVENLRTNIQTWGLKQLTILGTQIDEKVKVINSEIDNILVKKSEIESLKSNVESLIQPAVAGSLSKSFSDRKSDLKKNQRIWFWASVISSFIGAIATAYIINSLVGIFNSAIITEAIKKNINAGAGIIWTTIILRLGLLIPIYSIFGFSFMQFKKERDLEEIYAHKSAVAASLPNYGNLAIEDKVKDQVLSEASKVIFIAPNCKANDKEKSDIPSLDQLNNLIGNLQNLVSKAKE